MFHKESTSWWKKNFSNVLTDQRFSYFLHKHLHFEDA